MRRLASDWEQIRKDFSGHKNIIVTPVGAEPPEKYHVTYFVNGVYLLPDGKIETLNRHEVEITLHSEYPRYKPLCKILTPIYHPNFRDGQICIGDIWGAGESLTDIIINIGDMIQYRSWNSFSPLSADAAKWAIENKHLFPVGNIDLYVADYASAKDSVEIDMLSEDGESAAAQEETAAEAAAPEEPRGDGNDFEITAEELAGIEFVPTADRMQTMSRPVGGSGKKINFKTILVKGVLWALIGSFIGFFAGEIADGIFNDASIARMMGYEYLSRYYEYNEKADAVFEKGYAEFEAYCADNGYSTGDTDLFSRWYSSAASSEAREYLNDYLEYDELADEYFSKSYNYEFSTGDELVETASKISRLDTGIWSAIIALFIAMFFGIGEGIFYGSKGNALKYAAIGAAVALIFGLISGYFAQYLYGEVLPDDAGLAQRALFRGIAWAIMGFGIGVAVGLIKIDKKRILFCSLGGLAGGFFGGFLFDFICEIVPGDVVARGAGIVIMGLLIGIGVGLLEQFAKQAWLKVIRGEFEGKEYLVFAGTTSIGNNNKNTIVLFKDKLVGPHHCDIVLEGGKYVLVDCGTPMGTVVNGNRIGRHVLRQGDAIAVGNSVLVFNTK